MSTEGPSAGPPRRRSVRIAAYDYSQAGAYFVTVVTQGHSCLFGDIAEDTMHLGLAGEMVEREWRALEKRFAFVELDSFVVMPNHVHGILWLAGSAEEDSDAGRGEPCVRPCVDVHEGIAGEYKIRPYESGGRGTAPRSLGRAAQAFKSVTTHLYVQRVQQEGWPRFLGLLWQRNYYEHVIRHDKDLRRVREYVASNPLRWALDKENPSRWGGIMVMGAVDGRRRSGKTHVPCRTVERHAVRTAKTVNDQAA